MHTDYVGMGDEEFHSKVEGVLARRRALVASSPGLDEAYSQVSGMNV